jgi:glycosyltransferase involved in cell wall biosynthesis
MSHKYRVLHLTHDMGIGGTEQVICQLIRNLDTSKYQCDIACIDGEVGPLGQQIKAHGVNFSVFHRQPGFDMALIRNIRRLLRSERYDIVHCHQYTPYVYGMCAALFTGAKVVFTEHGRFHPDSYSWKRRLVNPLLGFCTHSIVAISAATARALEHYEWFSARAIDVIYNGIDPASSQPAADSARARSDSGVPQHHLVFGTIARFDTIKNIPMMIESFAQVHRELPETTLLLVGDGAERQKLEQLVAERGLTDAVVFTGYQEDTATFMSMIDVYLLTSFSEGTSMVLLEAMSTGTASIVTSVGGNVEIIEHEHNGLVVESDDIAGCTQSMMRLASDSDLRKALGAAALTVFNQRFSVSTMSSRYSETYERVLGLQ